MVITVKKDPPHSWRQGGPQSRFQHNQIDLVEMEVQKARSGCQLKFGYSPKFGIRLLNLPTSSLRLRYHRFEGSQINALPIDLKTFTVVFEVG